MDLSKFDVREASEAGAEMHLLHPYDDKDEKPVKHPLYTGEGAGEDGRLLDESKPHEPVLLYVRSYGSDPVKALLAKWASEDFTSKEDKDEDLSEADALKKIKASKRKAEKRGHDLIEALVVGWSGVTSPDGEALEVTKKNKIKIVFSNASFEAQVIQFARRQAHFFPKPAKG